MVPPRRQQLTQLEKPIVVEIIDKDAAARENPLCKEPKYEIITRERALKLMEEQLQMETILRYLNITREFIIMPLDSPKIENAFKAVEDFAQYVAGFKIGNILQGAFELSDRSVKELVDKIQSYGCIVFYDGKSLDIQHTMVETAKEKIETLKMNFYNVHAHAALTSIEAVVAIRGQTDIIGVTVLTDIGDRECEETFGAPRKPTVLDFAEKLVRARAQGLVCSGLELVAIKRVAKLRNLVTLIPAVRSPYAGNNEQVAVSTPGAVVEHDGDFAIIGRQLAKPEPEIGSILYALYLVGKEMWFALNPPAA